MVPAGPHENGRALAQRLDRGDAIVDGGNTHFKDDIRRARERPRKGCSTSMSVERRVWGAESGYCLMAAALRRRSRGSRPCSGRSRPAGAVPPPGPPRRRHSTRGIPALRSAGAGHFVKMIHNGMRTG